MNKDPFLINKRGQWRPLSLFFVEQSFRSQDTTGSPRIVGEKLANMARLTDLSHAEAVTYSFLAEKRVREMEEEIKTVIWCAERGFS